MGRMSDSDLSALLSQLSPDVRERVSGHVSAPEPVARASAPTATSFDDAAAAAADSSTTPLLSPAEVAALLPALEPEAKRWLRAVEHDARTTAQQHRAMKELGRYVLSAERARSDAERERAKLHKVCQEQAQALLASAARYKQLRRLYEGSQAELEREREKSRQLERALRATVRAER